MATVSGASLSSHGVSTNYTRVVNGNVVFAKEYIWLNGHKVKIGGSISDTARALNRYSIQTGVRAVVVNAGTSNERLKLVTRANNLTINDPKGVLSNLYKSKRIGTGDDMLIQIAASNKSRVKFSYGNSVPEKNLTQGLRLTESATKPLVVKKLLRDHNVQNIQNVQEDFQNVQDNFQDVQDNVQDVVEDPIVRREYLRRCRERTEQEMDRAYKEMSTISSQAIVAQVIKSRNLPNTTSEQIELTSKVVADEIHSSGIGEVFLRRKSTQVVDRIAKQIDSNRDKLSSIFSDKLKISEQNIRKATQTVLQKIKSEYYSLVADDILNGLGKTRPNELSKAVTDGLIEGRLSFDTVYNCCPNVKQKVSELLQGASKTHSSKYELYMNSVQIEKLKLEISNIESTDLGLV